MARRSPHLVGPDRAAAQGSTRGEFVRAESANATSTTPRAKASSGDSGAGMFDDVPAVTRRAMSTIACASPDPDGALPQVVALLIGSDDPRKLRAVVEAIQTNPALHQQWLRAWDNLRA